MNYTQKVLLVLELLQKKFVTVRFLKDVMKLHSREIASIIHDLRMMGYCIEFRKSSDSYYRLKKGIYPDFRKMNDYAVYADMDLWHDIIKPNLPHVLKYLQSFGTEPYYLKGYRYFHGIDYKVFRKLLLTVLKEHGVIKIERSDVWWNLKACIGVVLLS